MAGMPEVDWSVSVPDVVASAPIDNPELAEVRRLPETAAAGASDALITSWGFHRPAGQPVISVAHATFPAYREMMRATPHDHAVAVSRDARSVFAESEAVTTIYNGIDFARLAPVTSRKAARERLGIPTRATVVGFVGRWGHQKNPVAAAVAASTVPGCIALYAGPAPDPSSLEKMRAISDLRVATPELGLAIGDIYRAMDVCIVPSRSEGFSLAVAEAWYCRTPVMATAVGIAAEHPDAVVALPQDPDYAALEMALGQALALRGSKNLDNAQQLVVSTFSVDRMIAAWRNFLSEKLPGFWD